MARALALLALAALLPLGARHALHAEDGPEAAGAVGPPRRVRGERPPGRRSEAREVWITEAGADRPEWIVNDLDAAARERLLAALAARGQRPVAAERWPSAAQDPDLVALVRGEGRLPPGFVPHGMKAPEPIPPLDVLGGQVLLDLRDGVPEARVLKAPAGSLLANIGLTSGDVLLSIDGLAVDPRGLLSLGAPAASALQRTLTVRRTHGGIERIVIASWVREPSGR